MTTYDFVHLVLLSVGGEIKGKTRLQKTVYLLGLMTKQLNKLGFRAHYYGPYSADVVDAVNTLQGLGFIDQVTSGGGSLDPLGFEVKRVDLKLNADGVAVAKTKAARNPELWRKLQHAAQILQEKTGTLDYVKLSVVAKTYFMLTEKGSQATERELKQLATRFGWAVTEDQVIEAAGYLSELGLVTAAASKSACASGG